MDRFAVFYTGACMNTARAFGPAVVTGFNFPGHSRHWVVRLVIAKLREVISPTFVQYWAGPFLGSLLGVAFYTMLKWINYLELNPAQASTSAEDSPPIPNIFATERATRDTEASGGAVPPLAPNGQRKSNAE
ncbi:hypothetical protein JVT61DRAFT_14124 [Boletus reticuloceps]|uniref:Aquaporin n=1 Tax=Boletus reticuloceps TaxID=495285 RepID=A0A8I3A3B1_9AGAM|nr:hypothetical protein JVT61DRAFT_14124 [Boletus reticuloceps]